MSLFFFSCEKICLIEVDLKLRETDILVFLSIGHTVALLANILFFPRQCKFQWESLLNTVSLPGHTKRELDARIPWILIPNLNDYQLVHSGGWHK